MAVFRPQSFSPDLLAATVCRRVEKGGYLYRRGDPAVHVFMVERGRMCLYSTTSEGSTVPFYVVHPGEWVSEAALFADAYCGDVRAEVPSHVRVFPKATLLSAIREDPDLAHQFMAAQARRGQALRIRLELRQVRSARERVLQYVRAMATPDGDSFSLERPLKSLADDLGLCPESLYRTVAQLVKDGAIRREKRAIYLADRAVAAVGPF